MSVPEMLRDIAIDMFDGGLLSVGNRTSAYCCQDDGLGEWGAS